MVRARRRAATTAYVVRCSGLGSVAERLIVTLSAVTGVWPTLVCDERAGEIDAGSCPKVSLTQDMLDGFGLARRPDNWGWFCGDFCYYAAAAALPEADRFVLFDADVFLSIEAARILVARLDDEPAQAVALRLGDGGTEQKLSRGLGALGLSPALGCLFSVTRADRQVVAAMQDLRIEALALDTPAVNDEAILAGAVVRGGFTSARLESVMPGMFGSETFESNPPHLYEGLSLRSDTRAFHPVVDAQTVLARISTGERNYSRHRMRRVLAEATPALRKSIRGALAASEAAT